MLPYGMIYNRFNLIETIKKIDNVELIYDIANSFNKTQEESKTWLAEYLPSSLPDTAKVLVAAGWYGLMAQTIFHKLRCSVTSFDMNPDCEKWGIQLFDSIYFQTSKVEDFNCSKYDVIVSTSCEHFTDEVLNNFLEKRKKHSRVYLQSNNFYDDPTHVNCKSSVEEFAASVNLDIIKTDTLQLDYGFDRYLVIGK